MNQPYPIRLELPTQFGMKTVNTFLLKGEENVLIDSGEHSPATWDALQTGLGEANLQIEDIDRILITHAHVDHIGMAARVAEVADAEVWVSDKCKDWALNPHELFRTRGKVISQTLEKLLGKEKYEALSPMLYSFSDDMQSLWQPVPEDRIHIFPHSGHLQLAGIPWEVHYVPGHSHTQSCFFHRDSGTLLSADMLLRITPTPVIEDTEGSDVRNRSIFQLLDSYESLLQLPIDRVFPGHYEIFDQAHEVIDLQVGRIHLRKEECLTLIQAGNQDFLSLYSQMYQGPSLPAVNMLVGYLDLLESEGKIRIEEAYPEAAKIVVGP